MGHKGPVYVAEVHRDRKGSNPNAIIIMHTHTRPYKRRFLSQLGSTLQILYLATGKHHNYINNHLAAYTNFSTTV